MQGVRGPIVKTRRKRPSWMTTGKVMLAGTLLSVKVPSMALFVATSGVPETSAVQLSAATQATVVVKLASGALGT